MTPNQAHRTAREDDPRRAKGEIDLTSMPRPRLRRHLRGWLLWVMACQVVIGGGVLFLLQGAWRPLDKRAAPSTAPTLAGELLSPQILHRDNPLAQKKLDKIAAAPGVRFAIVTDADNRVVLSSVPQAASIPGLTVKVGEPVSAALAGVSADHPIRVGDAVVLTSELDTKPDRRLILGMADNVPGRVLLDGAMALATGFVGAIVLGLPIALWRVRTSTDGLSQLHRAIRRLAKGFAPQPLTISGDDEIAYLSAAFNSMAADIHASQQALRNANAELEQRVTARTEELHRANHDLERKNGMLAELTDTALRFTDDVAHEFRTPLAVILEFTSLMSDGLAGETSPEQQEHLAFISDAARDLTRLVDDFLDSSRLRAGRLPVHRKPYSVPELFDSVWKMLEAKAAGRNIRLRRDLQADLPRAFADLDKARRVLVNLVVNAVKFSREGDEVVIGAKRVEDGVAISVSDHGPGMSAAEVDRLFERFRQTSSGQRSGIKGFGLGLSITAELVALNLGDISVDSKPGAGSTFTFTLPEHSVESILRSHLARVLERDPGARLGALRVICPDDGTALNDLIEHIADVSQPRDLAIATPDGQSVFVVGTTTDIERWRERLAASNASEGPEKGDTSAPLHVEVIGEWPVQGLGIADLMERAFAPVGEEVAA